MGDLFKELSKDASIDRVVPILYAKMLEDLSLKRFFHDTDLDHLKRKQKWLLTSILMSDCDGTCEYLSRVHHRLVQFKGLNEQHFDRMIYHLDESLVEAGVCDDTHNKLLFAAKSLKFAVLGIGVKQSNLTPKTE